MSALGGMALSRVRTGAAAVYLLAFRCVLFQEVISLLSILTPLRMILRVAFLSEFDASQVTASFQLSTQPQSMYTIYLADQRYQQASKTPLALLMKYANCQTGFGAMT